MAKRAEAEFKEMMTFYGHWAHKWRDVMYCPHCSKIIFATDRNEDGKDNTIVDYLVFVHSVPAWVECKEGGTSYPFSDLTQRQRNFLDGFIKRGVSAMIFLLLGTGRVPNGRSAFMVPYQRFLEVEKAVLQERKSIDLKTANDLFGNYRLKYKGGWRYEA